MYTTDEKAGKRIPLQVSGRDVPDCPCELLDIDAGTLFVLSERQIPESSAIVVTMGHVELAGVVADCRPDDQNWVISIALSSRRRRLDQRIPHGEESTLAVIGKGNASLRPCQIIDTSSFGLGLRL